MEYLIDRMERGGATSIVVVTRPNKVDVVQVAESRGARVVYATPPTVSDSIMAGMEGLAKDAGVLVGFPDTIWEPADAFATMIERLESDRVVLGLFPSLEPERSDVVISRSDDSIEAILVKPTEPPSNWIWGCAAASAATFEGMSSYAEPGHYFDHLCGSGRVSGVRLSGPFVDVGTKTSLAAAQSTGW